MWQQSALEEELIWKDKNNGAKMSLFEKLRTKVLEDKM